MKGMHNQSHACSMKRTVTVSHSKTRQVPEMTKRSSPSHSQPAVHKTDVLQLLLDMPRIGLPPDLDITPLHDAIQDVGNLVVLTLWTKDAAHLHQEHVREHSLGPVQVLLAALDHEVIPVYDDPDPPRGGGRRCTSRHSWAQIDTPPRSEGTPAPTCWQQSAAGRRCTTTLLRPLQRQVYVLLSLDGRTQMGLADVDQHELLHLPLPALGRSLHDEDLHDLQRQGRCVESLAKIDLVLRPEVLCEEPALVDAEVLVDVQPPHFFVLMTAE